MKVLFVSLLIHAVVIFGLPFVRENSDAPAIDQVHASQEVIHLSFKLDDTEVKELKKKLDEIKEIKKKSVKKIRTYKKKVSKTKSVQRKRVNKVAGKKHLNKYFLELRRFIEKKKYYPKMALRMRQAGSVEICIEIDQDGNFHQVHIKNPSPFSSLNKAALALVEEISKFKPLPLEVGKKVTLNIPLKYALKK